METSYFVQWVLNSFVGGMIGITRIYENISKLSQQTFAGSKSTVETVEKGDKSIES